MHAHVYGRIFSVFVRVSCNCHTHIEKIQLWNKLSHVIGDVDCVLHLGDQIYGDSDFGTK